ncbi:unnamed protein product [Merluccius merluccius]
MFKPSDFRLLNSVKTIAILLVTVLLVLKPPSVSTTLQLNRGVSVAGTDIAALHLFLQTVVPTPSLPTVRDPIGRTVVIPISDTFLINATGATRLLLHLHHIVDRILMLTAVKVIPGTTARAGATSLHLHLHPIVDLTHILLAARGASGTTAWTGVTLLTA